MNAQTEALNRFEALIRWRHPQRGLIEPREFIPLAEKIGLIVPIGEWVLWEACIIASTWRHDISVAVNVSAAQLKSANLVNAVREALQTSKLLPNRLELEITETVLLQSATLALETLHQLQDIGLRISLDDFGTGYSSIGSLRSFPFNRIKIDQSFVRDLAARADSAAIVHAIVDLGCALGMSITAEGVETEDQLRMPRSEACTEVQGFLFGAPVPALGVPAVMARTRPAERIATLAEVPGEQTPYQQRTS